VAIEPGSSNCGEAKSGPGSVFVDDGQFGTNVCVRSDISNPHGEEIATFSVLSSMTRLLTLEMET
jgi:hypothetical protein